MNVQYTQALTPAVAKIGKFMVGRLYMFLPVMLSNTMTNKLYIEKIYNY